MVDKTPSSWDDMTEGRPSADQRPIVFYEYNTIYDFDGVSSNPNPNPLRLFDDVDSDN